MRVADIPFVRIKFLAGLSVCFEAQHVLGLAFTSSLTSDARGEGKQSGAGFSRFAVVADTSSHQGSRNRRAAECVDGPGDGFTGRK